LLLVARFESTHGLVDDWYNHAQYLPLFLLGYGLAATDGAWAHIERLRWPALWAALPCYLLLAWYFATYTDANPAPDWLRMSQRVAWGVNQWASIVAILGFAGRHLQRDSAALRYLSAAVFPVYILHQTVIVVLAHNAKALGLTPMIEGPLLVVATFALCFGGYELIKRAAWLRPLFGLKPLPKDRAATVEAVATS
jgi:surface polysaccharide O-acyltransferase-like enzyme